jgi:hypothetical protein
VRLVVLVPGHITFNAPIEPTARSLAGPGCAGVPVLHDEDPIALVANLRLSAAAIPHTGVRELTIRIANASHALLFDSFAADLGREAVSAIGTSAARV